MPDVFLPRLIELWQQGRFPVDRIMAYYDFDAIDRAAPRRRGRARDQASAQVLTPWARGRWTAVNLRQTGHRGASLSSTESYAAGDDAAQTHTVIFRSGSPARNERVLLERLNQLVAEVSESNRFQSGRLAGVALRSLEDLREIPSVDKNDLLLDQQAQPPFGRNLTYPLERYVHLHQTSGSSGSTLRVLDTEEDWDWWRECLHAVFAAAGVGPADLVAFTYSFGPYVQFWASYDGAGAVGANRIALGGMDSVQRLETIREYSVTALVCTPSYAIRLAQVADQKGLRDALASVTKIICTGEPGASLPAVRSQIESAVGGPVF